MKKGLDTISSLTLTHIPEEEDVVESEVAEAKAELDKVEEEALRQMKSLARLMNRGDETGTGTRREKRELEKLNKELSEIKDKVKESQTTMKAVELGFLRTQTRTKTNAILKCQREQEVEGALRSICLAERVDLAFVIDCTKSMGVHIDRVKKNIRDVVATISKTNSNLKLRLSVVGYRDFGDTPQYEVLDFVESITTFESFVGKLQALNNGNKDAAEDMAGGIKHANALNWVSPTRVCFVVADDPCHGTEFSIGYDRYPVGSPGINIIREIRCLAANHSNGGSMSVHFGKLTDRTDMMISRFKSYNIPFSVVSFHAISSLRSSITRGVRNSIFKTVTSSNQRSASFGPVRHVNASLKNYNINPVSPSTVSWKSLPAVHVQVFRNMPVGSIAELQNPLCVGQVEASSKMWLFHNFRNKNKLETRVTTMLMRRATDPFDEGQIRLAYHGQLAQTTEDLDKREMVMKSYKHVGKGVHDRKQYLAQMEVSSIARYLAEEFNRRRPAFGSATIHVLDVCVVEEEGDNNEHTGDRRFCVEELLPQGSAEFQKYSSNSGWWNEDSLEESLLRFTKFTYWVTNKYLLVTDLQGVKHNGEFYLTDPVILCADVMRFGNTNLGEKAMSKVLQATNAMLEEKGWK